MNQDIIVEKYTKGSWQPVFSSLIHKRGEANKDGVASMQGGVKHGIDDIQNLYTRIRPFISVKLVVQDTIITSALLSVGNPDHRFAQGLVGSYFRIKMGYTNIKNAKFVTNLFPVFVGAVIQPPYYTDSGQGTDQVLTIPLMFAGLPKSNQYINYSEGDKLGSILNAIFKDNKFSQIKNITYLPKDLENKELVGSGTFDFNRDNYQIIVNHFERVENIYLRTDNLDKLFVTEIDELRAYIQGGEKQQSMKGEGDNAGVIYNASKNSISARGDKYVNTFLKTKYAVIGLDNSLSVELAFALPNVIGKRYAKIQNPNNGNIYIYDAFQSSRKNNKTYYITRQEITFSTYGDSSHKLNLLAQFEPSPATPINVKINEKNVMSDTSTENQGS